MAAVAVNDAIALSKGSRPGRLSFVAVGKSRRLFGLCSGHLAREIVGSGALIDGTGKSTPVHQVLLPPSFFGANAVKLMGAFEFDYSQEFDFNRIPTVAISPFDALGKEVHVFRRDD